MIRITAQTYSHSVRCILVIATCLCSIVALGQESQTVYNFLRLPASAHAAALGGDAIALTDDDGSLLFHNPALIQNVTDRSLTLGMMTYMEGSVVANADYVWTSGQRGTWAVDGRFINYGSMKETDPTGLQTGTFSARDVALGAAYSYGLFGNLSGGISAKLIGSYIGSYNSVGAAVDIGINYFNPTSQWSLSAVVRNLGGQLSAYEDDFERLPLDVQLGVSKRLTGSPLRFTASLVRLNDWQYGIGHHLQVGADLLLGEQFYIAAGYNSMRAREMKIASGDGESSHGAALSFGCGLMLERLKLHVTYARYHVSTASLLVNFSYCL